ncbi:MAG: hypothetical protein ACXWKG_14505 [Limisphaerales bacterium]
MDKLTRNLLIVGLALAVWGISFLFTGEPSNSLNGDDPTKEICHAQLDQIQRAKMKWANDHKEATDAIPPVDQLLPYFPRHKMPECPGMGRYILNAVTNPPHCSITTHVYP